MIYFIFYRVYWSPMYQNILIQITIIFMAAETGFGVGSSFFY